MTAVLVIYSTSLKKKQQNDERNKRKRKNEEDTEIWATLKIFDSGAEAIITIIMGARGQRVRRCVYVSHIDDM